MDETITVTVELPLKEAEDVAIMWGDEEPTVWETPYHRGRTRFANAAKAVLDTHKAVLDARKPKVEVGDLIYVHDHPEPSLNGLVGRVVDNPSAHYFAFIYVKHVAGPSEGLLNDGLLPLKPHEFKVIGRSKDQ